MQPSSQPVHVPTRADVEAIIALADPVLRNFRITIGYHALAVALAARLGADAACNWCAFAVWASKQAGTTIRGEDLRRTLQRVLGVSPGVASAVDALARAAQSLGSDCSRGEVGAAAGAILVTEEVVRRAADAVARGNQRVFAEVGITVAHFLEYGDRVAGDAPGFDWLTDGDPPDGQGYLRRALTHYEELRTEPDPKRRAELLLLANLEIGYHEQVRVQPEIAEAANVALPEPAEVRGRLMAMLFPRGSRWLRLRSALWRLIGRKAPLDVAIDRLIDSLRLELRRVLTQQVMGMDLAGIAALRLGKDLAIGYPPRLARVEHPELVALLARIDPAPDTVRGSGAKDWADVTHRLHYIAELFRCFQETAEVAGSPYNAEQVAAIRAGQVPQPPH